MLRTLTLVTLVAALCAAAAADEVVLQDGRKFTGTVTVKDETVLIQMSYGTVSFPRWQVQTIKLQPTIDDELTRRFSQIDSKDTDSLCRLAVWAKEKGLSTRAADLYARVLKIDPDNLVARKACGQVRIDGRWYAFADALELARGKLQAGRLESLQDDLLPALLEIAPKDKYAVIHELQATIHLQGGQFSAATAIFTDLAKKTSAPSSVRYAAIADILTANADGMYVLTEPYPADSPLVGRRGSLRPGPASLAHPLVLEAALRDRARTELKAGKELMDAATKLEATDPDSATAKYAQAVKSFDRSDAMIGGISRSYRIAIAKRRIVTIRKDSERDARKFDDAMAKLGQKDLPPQTYRAMVIRMKHDLDNVRDSLKAVLDLAKPYPRELVLEIAWAQRDLRRIESMRDVLNTELNEK